VLRLGLALLVFLPFLRLRGVSIRTRLRLTVIGAVQFGLMYLLYLRAYVYLQGFEVALFTVFTPLYVVLIDAALERTWRPHYLGAALLAAIGAAVTLRYGSMSDGHIYGFLLMQGSNLCFAIGQLLWRREHDRLASAATDAQLFALPYAGAFLIAWLVSLFSTDWLALRLNGVQALSIVYLGVVASGLCFFWWNVGAERVNAGTLASLNNAKMPLGVVCALLIFGEFEFANYPRLIAGLVLLAAAVWLAERRRPTPAPDSRPQ
jgi:drug/metabolite transporter (DMT)-like permease